MVDGHTDNEKELIQRATEGESSAFGLLYDRYQPAIYRFIYLKVSRREDAEDLTHQVFLSAWQTIEHFIDHGLPFASWLYRIARNKVIDHYRTQHTPIHIEAIAEEALGATEGIEKETATRLDMQRVMEALKMLSHEQQDIILMRFVQELSHKEIARAIGKTQGAVRIIQMRALKKIKKAIEQ
ncbi:MAG: sigma-70 family RNA polymerase sigma factor [Candidatus Pacebacteria bacterium]|nr:sigma-70 family RNA polymerase sigma factor [Candidatus Paceibacterota bacterium]